MKFSLLHLMVKHMYKIVLSHIYTKLFNSKLKLVKMPLLTKIFYCINLYQDLHENRGK